VLRPSQIRMRNDKSRRVEERECKMYRKMLTCKGFNSENRCHIRVLVSTLVNCHALVKTLVNSHWLLFSVFTVQSSYYNMSCFLDCLESPMFWPNLCLLDRMQNPPLADKCNQISRLKIWCKVTPVLQIVHVSSQGTKIKWYGKWEVWAPLTL